MTSRERPGPLAHLERATREGGRYRGGEGAAEPIGADDARRATSHEPAVGATLGRDYRLTSLLVRTLGSTIYAAEHVRTHRRLAVKVWRKQLDELELDQFRAEAEVLASIRHPHVAQVIDFGSTEERTAYLVMELLEGRTLETLLEAGPLSAAQVARLTRQIASALAAAHRAGLLHTDLRPHNVLLVDVGRDLYAKLLDFGLTKRIDGPRGPSSGRRRRSDHAAWYRAPELSSPVGSGGLTEPAADARSDQFSLACVVYEMFTGLRPFPSAEGGQTVIHRTRPRSLAESGFAASPELEEAVARALSVDPAARFEQLGDFAQVVACAAPADRTLVTRAGLGSLTRDSEPGAPHRADSPDGVVIAERTAGTAPREAANALAPHVSAGSEPSLREAENTSAAATSATLPDGALPPWSLEPV